VLALAAALVLAQAQADPSLGRTWERRAPRDLQEPATPPPPELDVPPEVRALSDDALAREIVRAGGTRDARRLEALRAEEERRAAERGLAEEDRRLAQEAAEARAAEDDARRAAAEARLAAEHGAREAKLAALEEDLLRRDAERLARDARRRELAIGGVVLLALVASAALVWRSVRGRRGS
jgi:dTMP kinase